MPLIEVRVVPRAKQNVVVMSSSGLTVRVTAAPADGRANEAVLRLLADYWQVPKSRLNIVRGLTSRRKTIERP